jgi:hypothetical protein
MEHWWGIRLHLNNSSNIKDKKSVMILAGFSNGINKKKSRRFSPALGVIHRRRIFTVCRGNRLLR